MKDATPSIEDLLERRLPSAAFRDDAALAKAGVSDAELARTKDSVAAIGLTTSPEAPPPSVRDRVVASTARLGKFGIFADRVARLFDIPVAEAETLMKRLEEPDAWMPFLIEGVDMVPVMAGPKLNGAIATLVRIPPGTSFPQHKHAGEETMVVLDGGFKEDAGEEVWRGDEIIRGDGTGHTFVALPGVPCIAAAVIFGHADFG